MCDIDLKGSPMKKISIQLGIQSTKASKSHLSNSEKWKLEEMMQAQM